MKALLLSLQRIVALACLTATAAWSQVEPPATPGGGLNVNLTPGGYKFTVTQNGPAGRGAATRLSFPAGVAVSNRGRTPVVFTFPDTASAETKWTFRVFDAEGSEVWKSEGLIGAQVLTEKRLGPGQTWRRLVQVPLQPGGKALAPGLYTLEASLDAAPTLGASTLFEIVAGDQPPPPPVQGIAGLVLKPADAPADPPAEVPAAGAFVQVQQIVLNVPPGAEPPFAWTGRADEAGNFRVNTPAGRFRVTASLSSNTGTVVLPPKTIEVTVEPGRFTEAVIRLTPGVQPPTRQGLGGTVQISRTEAGVVSVMPVPNAEVIVEQIAPPANTPPFRWAGKTNANGRFEVLTPVGRFKVTALFPPGPAGSNPLPPPPVTIEVGVEAGVFRQVTLTFGATGAPQ
jgi:hypothetical protein